MRVLLVEDDSLLAHGVAEALTRLGWSVETLGSGAQADAVLACTAYDLLILDIGLPGLSGMEVLHRLRARGQALPVMMLTARDGLQDRVDGLNSGADDYLVKPFMLPELTARAQALIRRGRSAARQRIQFGPLALDMGTHEARLSARRLELTGRELSVLERLMLDAPKVVPKARLADSLSRWDREITPNAVELYVSRLRGKLATGGVGILTVRGIGYRLVEQSSDLPCEAGG